MKGKRFSCKMQFYFKIERLRGGISREAAKVFVFIFVSLFALQYAANVLFCSGLGGREPVTGLPPPSVDAPVCDGDDVLGKLFRQSPGSGTRQFLYLQRNQYKHVLAREGSSLMGYYLVFLFPPQCSFFFLSEKEIIKARVHFSHPLYLLFV